MPVFQVVIADRASGPNEHLLPGVREALKKALDPLQQRLTQDVRARALAHIHTTGKKPGLYLASIYGGVSDKTHRVSGYVRSSNPLAHLLEYGVADTGAHDILPNVARVLKFMGDAGAVFARLVHHPGANIPAYPAFGPALEARKAEIEATLTQAAETAAKG